MLFQSTETGTHGACGASALSHVDRERENACVSATTRRPNLEGRVALAQIDKPCHAVCRIVLVSSKALKTALEVEYRRQNAACLT